MSVGRVGHVVGYHPAPQQDYIRRQVVQRDGRADVILALRGRSEPTDATRVLAMRGPAGPVGELIDRGLQRLAWPVWRTGAERWVAKAARRSGAEVLHAHFGMAGAAVADAARRSGRPLVTSFYGVDASACLTSPRWLRRYAELWEAGDRFLVLSDPLVDRLAAVGAPRERIAVVDLAIDLDAYAFRVPAIDPDAPRLLCAARFVEKKGHGILLEAFARLRSRLPGATLTLAGYGPLLPQIRVRINELGLTHAVDVIDTTRAPDFTGLLADLLVRHDVFVLLSIVGADGDDEAGPALTAVCAQAAGMPVILTPFVGAERSLVDGETGLAVDPEPDAVAAGVVRIAADSALAARLGSAAAALVRERFARATMLRELEAQYREVLR